MMKTESGDDIVKQEDSNNTYSMFLKMAMFAVVVPILGEITEMGRNEDGNDIVIVYNKPLLIVHVQQRNPISVFCCRCSDHPLFYVSQYVVFRQALYGSVRGLLFYLCMYMFLHTRGIPKELLIVSLLDIHVEIERNKKTPVYRYPISTRWCVHGPIIITER